MSNLVNNIENLTNENTFFRKVILTTSYQQLVVMHLNPSEDIGMEVHNTIDQFIKIEKGKGVFEIGKKRRQVPFQEVFSAFIPANKWQNVKASSDVYLYSIYAPPHIRARK
jgi:hypothetical protein